MATASPIKTYSDREFLFRLETLVFNGGTQVVRNIFDQRLQNQSFSNFLARQQSTINRLRRQDILTREQYDRLYPSNGELPTSSDLDMTLIVCMLRHLPSLGCNQNYNWSVPPQTGDMSVEADLCRLQVFHNEIAKMSSPTGYQQSSFEAKWNEIEAVLLRLDQKSPTPNFSQTIDSYKYNPIDPAKEQKRTMIEQRQERDQGLKIDVQPITKDLSDTTAEVKSTKKDVKRESPVPGRRGVSGIVERISKFFGFGLKDTPRKDLVEEVEVEPWRPKPDVHITYVSAVSPTFSHGSHDIPMAYLSEEPSRIDVKKCTPRKDLVEEVEDIDISDVIHDIDISDVIHDIDIPDVSHETRMVKDLAEAVKGWRDCLQMTDEAGQIEAARKLLVQEILPDQAQLCHACSVFGRCSKTFLDICSSISEHIKSKSNDVIDVWAAYRYYEYIKGDYINPVFVVITKKGKAGIGEKGFDVIERDEADFSSESEKVFVEVENDLSSVNIFPDSQMTDIEKCVSLYADSLMDKHRNLNIVSPSVKKSTKFEKIDAHISDELCVALYVHIKGFIPIAEEPFPSKIGEFRTDVLEGGFKLFHGGPYDYHEQLKMGLAIHANVTNNNGECLFGTLGGFLDYPPNGMCALTCAHVVLTTPEMQQLITCNQLNFIKKEVFQSLDPKTQPFGQVVSAIYRTGDQNSSGIDAALIKITQRHPRDGSFPAASNYADAGFDERNQMVYSKGKVSPLDRIRRRAEVYKYGISTGVTRGSLGFRGSFVKTSEPFEYRLHNQIEVLRTGDACFASPGDSGALVFFDDTEDDSVAIGIVEGGHTNNRIVYVTPICEILKNIGTAVSMSKFINAGSVSNDSGLDMDIS